MKIKNERGNKIENKKGKRRARRPHFLHKNFAD